MATLSRPAEHTIAAKAFGYLLAQWPFWLLLIGSLCSIGSIGAINQHMKLVFKDSGIYGPAGFEFGVESGIGWDFVFQHRRTSVDRQVRRHFPNEVCDDRDLLHRGRLDSVAVTGESVDESAVFRYCFRLRDGR